MALQYSSPPTQPRLTARFGTTLVAIVLFALLLRLGFWQLDRAREKSARADEYAERRSSPPLDLINAGSIDPEQLQWRRVRATGRYGVSDLLLDNRTRAGRVGFEVLSTFTLDNGINVLVDRGFIAAGNDRSRAPEVPTPASTAKITGYAGPVPVTGLRLNAAAESIENLEAGLARIQRVDLAQLERYFKLTLEPYVIYLDENAPHGFDRRWVPPGDGAARHKAYATQWFTMAGVLVVIMGVLMIRTRTGEAR